MTLTAQQPGSLFWCHAVCSSLCPLFCCKGKLPNLRAGCFAVVLYYVTLTWPQFFKGSLQVTVAGLLPLVTVEHRHLWHVMQRETDCW